MEGKSILFITSELYPYFPETILSKKALRVSKEMLKNGNDIRIFIPKYGFINQRRYQLHEVIRLSGMNLIINDIDQPLIIKVATVPGEKVQSYFIDNDEYFNAKNPFTDDDEKFLTFNDERTIFFARGVLETVKKLNWKPDIIHVHGWMSSLVPLYLKKFYQNDSFYKDTTVVVSLFNDYFSENLDANFINKLKIDGFDEEDIAHLENATYESLIKTALMHSDIILKVEEELPEQLNDILKDYNILDQINLMEGQTLHETYSTIYQQSFESVISR
ncbi:MAG: glycogen/starch synthase [Solirubrobacteraceae bacterium]